eukprot:scaffold114198_cov33-Phaeocystis_antarctica.AAC.1
MHSTHSNSLYPPYLPGKLEELRHMFVNMDTDDSGTYSTLSIEEFKKAMALHPEVPSAQNKKMSVPMAQIEKMFRDMDITHSGEVDYTEFIAAANATTGAIEKPST